MYYVIKKQHETPLSTFVGFSVEKFINSKSNHSIIFEFQKDGKPIRKWVEKKDMILLTDNKEYYQNTLRYFSTIEDTKKRLVKDAQLHLMKAMETFTNTMQTSMDTFEKLKDCSDIPCMLKNL